MALSVPECPNFITPFLRAQIPESPFMILRNGPAEDLAGKGSCGIFGFALFYVKPLAERMDFKTAIESGPNRTTRSLRAGGRNGKRNLRGEEDWGNERGRVRPK